MRPRRSQRVQAHLDAAGKDLTIEQGHQSARLTAINHLAMIKAVIGDLDDVVRIVKVIG